MPFVQIKTNTSITSVQQQRLKTQLGQDISTLPGKSEQWLMISFEPETHLWFRGTAEPAALVEVSAFGEIAPSAATAFTSQLCALLHDELGLSPDRIYVKYMSTPTWGWNGQNF